ncbi:MAG: hypothetical protein ACK5XN_23010 [Bacteroidota bacterium]
MKMTLLCLGLFLTTAAFGASFDIPGLNISTSDFREATGLYAYGAYKTSVDGRCKLDRKNYNGVTYEQIYITDKKDVEMFVSFQLQRFEGGTNILFSQISNENCTMQTSEKDELKNVVIKCSSFGISEKLSISVDEDSLIRNLTYSSFLAGIGAYGVPGLIIKKLKCEF